MGGGAHVEGDVPRLCWTVHPARRRPGLAAAVAALLVVFLAAVYVSFGSLAVVALSAAFLVGSLLPFWAPTRFELTQEGIAIFGPLPLWQRRPWAQFRAFEVAANGVLVSPFREPSRLDNFRGVFLRTEGNWEAVVEYLQTVVGLPDRRDDRAVGHST